MPHLPIGTPNSCSHRAPVALVGDPLTHDRDPLTNGLTNNVWSGLDNEGYFLEDTGGLSACPVRIANRQVVLVSQPAAPDDTGHYDTRASPPTSCGRVVIRGKTIHRVGDFRHCGGRTTIEEGDVAGRIYLY